MIIIDISTITIIICIVDYLELLLVTCYKKEEYLNADNLKGFESRNAKPKECNMKQLLTIGITFMLCALATLSYAGSPITSTPFSDVYDDIEIVTKAKTEGIVGFEIARYLSSSKVPIDIKAAIINALSWDINGKKNAELFSYYLGLKYRKSLLNLSMEQLTADELFCLGYLSVMDDYYHPENAIPILKMAREEKPKSYTVAIILALTQAQNFMKKDLKKVWQVINAVIEDTNLKQDLRPEAKKIILDYMDSFKN